MPDKAYEVARGWEKDLIPDYEWLFQNASVLESYQVTETILSNPHAFYYVDHALRMAGMMGPECDTTGPQSAAYGTAAWKGIRSETNLVPAATFGAVQTVIGRLQ